MTTKQFQVFKEFTERMKLELEINSHKGDWVPWKNDEEILNEVTYHVDKLIKQREPELIRKQSAALANIALFMYNSTLPLYIDMKSDPKWKDENMAPAILYKPCPNCNGRKIIGHGATGNCINCDGSGIDPTDHR